MTQRDGQEVARLNEQRILKALHKFSWLRTRDIAALFWVRGQPKRSGGYWPEPILVGTSALRSAPWQDCASSAASSPARGRMAACCMPCPRQGLAP